MKRKETKQRLKELEKAWGMKGKKKKTKEKKIRPRDLYDVTLGNFQFHLYDCILMINGIPREFYLYGSRSEGTTLVRDIEIDEFFKTLSKLDWENPSDIDGLIFHGRFATNLLLAVAHSTHKILKKVYEMSEEEDKKYKWLMRYLDQWISCVDLFVAAYLSSNISYLEHLDRLYSMLLVVEEGQKTADTVMMNLSVTRTILTDYLRRRSVYEDPVIMNNLTKIAYVLATDSLNVRRTPKFDETLTFDAEDQMEEQIARLGYAILKFRVKKDYVPPLYQVFLDSNPQIVSKYADRRTPEIMAGLGALTMFQIFTEDEKIKKFIKEKVK